MAWNPAVNVTIKTLTIIVLIATLSALFSILFVALETSGTMTKFILLALISLTVASCRTVGGNIPTTDSIRIKVCERVIIVHDTTYGSIPEQPTNQI